jgi:hypothetical protein
MGVDLSWPTRDEAVAAAERNLSEFELITERFKLWSPEKLATYVDKAVITPEPERSRRKPHAYSDNQLGRLSNDILRLEPPLPVLQLHRYTDEFAVFIGHQARHTSERSPAQRLKDLDEGIVRPSRRLISALRDPNLRNELILAAALPPPYNIADVTAALENLERACQAQCKALSASKRSGKRWHSGIVKKHVFLTELFCEFLDPEFYSSRDTRLQAAAEILAEPIFPRATKFVGAARGHANFWNMIKTEIEDNREALSSVVRG